MENHVFFLKSIRLIILEFLNNEDVKELYIYSKSVTKMIASRNCAVEANYEKGIFFVKISNASKLNADLMSTFHLFYLTSSLILFILSTTYL